MFQMLSTRICKRRGTSDDGLSILKPNNVPWLIICKSNVIPDADDCFNVSSHWTARSTLYNAIQWCIRAIIALYCSAVCGDRNIETGAMDVRKPNSKRVVIWNHSWKYRAGFTFCSYMLEYFTWNCSLFSNGRVNTLTVGMEVISVKVHRLVYRIYLVVCKNITWIWSCYWESTCGIL